MGIRPRAVIFDLDAAVIDSRPAWRYALEEAVAMVTGERIDADPLAEEYRGRPWDHAVSIVVHERAGQVRCAELCEQYYRRSALKRLLVFEGIGMALDQLRGEGIAMGAVSRERHRDAMRQIESTGVDRFFTVLSPTNEGPWDPGERFLECVEYLEFDQEDTVYVSPDDYDLSRVSTTGAVTLRAGWAIDRERGDESLTHPSQVWAAICRLRRD